MESEDLLLHDDNDDIGDEEVLDESDNVVSKDDLVFCYKTICQNFPAISNIFFNTVAY